MRELWRKAIQLLKEHPVLWVPLACASATSYYLNWLRRLINNQIIIWARTSHSVLGGVLPKYDPDYSWMHRALLISAPIAICIQFAIACGYVLAFYFSARFVQARLGNDKRGSNTILSSAKSRWKSILIFSLKLIVFMAILLAATDMPLIELLRIFHKTYIPAPWFVPVTGVVVFVALALLMIPAAIRLIADEPLPEVSARMKKQACFIAVLAGVTGLAISQVASMAVRALESSFQPDRWIRDFVLLPADAIASDLPLAALWVVLALIAYRDLQMPEIPSPS